MADLVVNTSLLNDRGSDFEKISKKISAIANETDKTIKSLNSADGSPSLSTGAAETLRQLSTPPRATPGSSPGR